MPLKVKRFYTSVFLVLFSFFSIASAQNSQPEQSPSPQTIIPQSLPPASPQTSGDIMRERISKAKAFIAVRNYNAAIYELEGIRRETNDAAVQAVTNVLLMNSYLEQGDYKRAQEFLNQTYAAQKTTKPNAAATYFAVAGQVVKGARNRIERYRALGLNVSDRTLPLEAVNDLEKMRETLELVVTQAKETGADKLKSADAMALLEEASNSRSVMARDDYDARRWKDEVADTREKLTSSRSVVLNAVSSETPSEVQANQNNVAQNTTTATTNTAAPFTNSASANSVAVNAPDTTPAFKSVIPEPNTKKPSDSLAASNSKPTAPNPIPVNEVLKKESTPNIANNADTGRNRVVDSKPIMQVPTKKEEPVAIIKNAKDDSADNKSLLSIGSLIAYATKQTQPVYPLAAKSMRTTGVVKVEVTINENGEVSEVQKASGPPMLQAAAKDAIMKWRFRPFVRDGQPVKATGFVSFNFSL